MKNQVMITAAILILSLGVHAQETAPPAAPAIPVVEGKKADVKKAKKAEKSKAKEAKQEEVKKEEVKDTEKKS